MNIYFVNRYSKLKGPYDIIDSNREHIIRVGDICLHDYVEGLAFLVVQSTDNSWNACKRVGIGKNQIVTDLGNTLLFSFDGLHQRKGNLELLKQLLSCYREKVIYDFFNNAIDILDYKRDFWDISLFQRFLADSQEIIKLEDVKEQSAGLESNIYPTVFAKYLNADLLELLIANLEEGRRLKESYEILREKDGASFRASLMRFLVENPYGSIYERLPYSLQPQIKEEEKPATPVEEKTQEVIADDLQTIIIQDYHNKEFKKLYNRYQKGDKKAYEQLVKNNMPLVELIAKSYTNQGLDNDDIIQEGTIGLMKAIERFNINRNVPFSLYARWWILQAITQSLFTLPHTVRIPIKQISIYKKVRKFIDKYEQENGYEPSIDDFDIDADQDSLKETIEMPDNLLRVTTGERDLDSFPSTDPFVDDNLMKESRTIYVDGIISRLKDREASILRAAYGLGQAQIPLSEIGERFGLSRERVRQIVEKAVSRLRKMLKIRGSSSEEDEEETNDKDNKSYLKKSEPVKKVKKTQRIEWTPNPKYPDKDEFCFGNFRIVNNSSDCEIRNQNNYLIYTSQGRIFRNGDCLYRVCLLNNYFFIYKIEREGLAFKTGENIVYGSKTSPLCKMLSGKEGLDHIKEIKYDLVSKRYIVYSGGTWYDKNGYPLKETKDEHHVVETKNVRAEEISQIIKKIEVERYTQDTPKRKMKSDAAIGDVIIYGSKTCVVIDKKNRDDSSRLVVKYENGSIDNIKNDPSRYQIRPDEKKIENDDISNDESLSHEFVKSKQIRSIFDKKATSYKYFWFLAIISLARERQCLSLSYKDILIRMVALAWPIVLKERIELGGADQLYNKLSSILSITTLTTDSSSSVVEIFLSQNKNYYKTIDILSPLLKNVPYRFLSPWVKYTLDDEVIKKSQESIFSGIYALYDKYLMIREDWMVYIIANYNTIWDFTLDSFIDYIKRYNALTDSKLMAIRNSFYNRNN